MPSSPVSGEVEGQEVCPGRERKQETQLEEMQLSFPAKVNPNTQWKFSPEEPNDYIHQA